MGINLIESIRGEQIFEYKFPDFFNENREIGHSADDFEVLQVLGSGAFGNVLKVKSKKNLEIYAMKKVDKNLLGEGEERFYRNEQIILSKLKSPLVCRCYTTFEDENYLYFVMEFMNNGDLISYFLANKSSISEEKLWEIFFKCISGLLYVHNQGIIHLDIKPHNLFLDDNFNIKVGDFNVSAAKDKESAKNFTDDNEMINQLIDKKPGVGTPGYMAPEVENGINYDQKADVYSMGISFFLLAYGDNPYGKKGRHYYYSQNLYKENGEALNSIIDKMIEEDVARRYTTLEAYKNIKNIYIDQYVKNSSIKSALKCFYNFKNFREFFLNDNNRKILIRSNVPKIKNSNNFLNDNKVQMGNSVFDSIQTINGVNEFQKNSNLFDLRKNMENYGLSIKYNEEIQIGKFIFYFLKILNSILNEAIIDENDVKTFDKIDKELVYLSPSNRFENGQEIYVFNKIKEVYNKRMSSLISKNFINYIKTKKRCMLCYYERNYFSMINYIPFNVNILTKNCDNNNLNIYHGFNYLLNDEKIFNEQKGIKCEKCKKATVHKESKSFFCTAKNLIFIFNRGENCENKSFIDFDEQLILLDNVYQLIGIIELKEDGEYISFTRNDNNNWCTNGDENNITQMDVLKCVGTVVSLFYYCNNYNMIPKSNSSEVQQQIKTLSLSENNVNINPNNSIYNNINNTNYNRSNIGNSSNNVNNLNMNNMNLGNNINVMNHMVQPNITYPFPNPPNNMSQFPFQYNPNYNPYNNNLNNYNMQGQNFTGQNNMYYNNNNIQNKNIQFGNNNFYNIPNMK